MKGVVDLFYETLEFAIESKGSDIHITEGDVPYARIDGNLVQLKGFPIVTNEDMKLIFNKMNITEEQLTGLSYDGSYKYEDTRFRVHVFGTLHGWSMSLRLIPTEIPRFDDLHLPEVAKSFTQVHNGLILVTGTTGSGKSTTLSSLIQNINEEQNKRIITVEDPIEFVYTNAKSQIVQRQLGENFTSFSGAIKEAMRQDPDIILVGELRDLDTIKNAITLAETGHLVFGTLHTKSVSETFDRMIDVFPADQQQQIRTQIANVTQGILTQRLIKKEGGGRVPVVEAMVMTSGIKNIVAKSGNLSGIEDQILMNHTKNGSQTFIQSLASLVTKGLVNIDSAMKQAGNKEQQQKLREYVK